MRKLLTFAFILLFGVLSSACVNTFAVHELNQIAADYLESGDVKSAISRLESSIDLDGSVYESRYNLAVSYLRVGECEKSLHQAIEAEKLIKDEPAVYYTIGVANNCMADNIYEKKNAEGEIEKITYNDKAIAYQMAQKCIQYLTDANKNFDNYTRLAPNAEDTKDVLNLMNENNERISALKAEYNTDK